MVRLSVFFFGASGVCGAEYAEVCGTPAADGGIAGCFGFPGAFSATSGVRPGNVESASSCLTAVTAEFAQQLAQAAGEVPRDENGLFAVSREEILADSPYVYDALEQQFPFLAFDDTGVKGMYFSRLMSIIDFTGFYCPYTGEANVNVDSPACLLPSTAAHEMAHQRGIASEQECNFLAVLASTTSV